MQHNGGDAANTIKSKETFILELKNVFCAGLKTSTIQNKPDYGTLLYWSGNDILVTLHSLLVKCKQSEKDVSVELSGLRHLGIEKR